MCYRKQKKGNLQPKGKYNVFAESNGEKMMKFSASRTRSFKYFLRWRLVVLRFWWEFVSLHLLRASIISGTALKEKQ